MVPGGKSGAQFLDALCGTSLPASLWSRFFSRIESVFSFVYLCFGVDLICNLDSCTRSSHIPAFSDTRSLSLFS